MKHIFITGATSGLGKAAALHLADEGAVIIAASRNPEKGAKLLADYREQFPKGKGRIELVECNLASFESISMACDEILESYDHLDAIINNAGVMARNFTETRDGIELTWQINLLAPLLISHLLIPKFKKALEPKLIFTSSGFHIGRIDLEDPEFIKKHYISWQAYRQSKLGLILLTHLLAPRLTEEGIGVYVQHPGLVNTDLARSSGRLLNLMFRLMGSSPEKGASTLLYLANTSNEDLISGEYYARSRVMKSSPSSYDLDKAEKLLGLIKKYLKKHITERSLIFP
jgi:NAD(P)-dependent dehydrogenase (short-subunit alcohol dehydrogenase family)